MATNGRVSPELKRQLDGAGYGLGLVRGGPRKHRYYTPSGDEVWSIPSIREWVRKDEDGKIVDQGTRDANLDKGWTLTMPSEADLKLHCKQGCNGYHDTLEEVERCIARKEQEQERWEAKARAMRGEETSGGGQDVGEVMTAIAALTTQVAAITEVVSDMGKRFNEELMNKNFKRKTVRGALESERSRPALPPREETMAEKLARWEEQGAAD